MIQSFFFNLTKAIYCLYIAHKYELKQLNIIDFRKRFVVERYCDRGEFEPLGEKAFIGHISMRKTVEPRNVDALQFAKQSVNHLVYVVVFVHILF